MTVLRDKIEKLIQRLDYLLKHDGFCYDHVHMDIEYFLYEIRGELLMAALIAQAGISADNGVVTLQGRLAELERTIEDHEEDCREKYDEDWHHCRLFR